MKIGVVDYKAGNLRSVETALQYLGAEYFITDRPEELSSADKLIFPGVGEAAFAMQVLRESGIGEALKDFAATGKDILGICLGSQIILEFSEERDVDCLGLIPGQAKKFVLPKGYKVPHMGWNQVTAGHRPWNAIPLMKGVKEGSSFFFVHSYYTEPALPEYSLVQSDYGGTFTAGLQKDNVTAFQFHPEKSGPDGLRILQNYISEGGR